MAITVLTTEEAREVLERHPYITADIIPTYGLRIEDRDRDLLVGLNRQTGEIKIFDLTYIDSETGQRVTMTEAQIKAFLFEWWKYKDPLGITGWLSEIKAPELIVGAVVVLAGIWIYGQLK